MLYPEHLQLDVDFTLDKPKKQIRQWEAVQGQQQVQKGVGNPDTLEAVHSHTEQVYVVGDLKSNITIGEDLLLCGGRIVVLQSLWEETLKKLHQGHQGIQQCHLRAQSSVWWPGVSRQISDFIK